MMMHDDDDDDDDDDDGDGDDDDVIDQQRDWPDGAGRHGRAAPLHRPGADPDRLEGGRGAGAAAGNSAIVAHWVRIIPRVGHPPHTPNPPSR